MRTYTRTYSYDKLGNVKKLKQLATAQPRSITHCVIAGNHADQLFCYYNQVGTSDPTVYTQYDYDAGGKRLSKLVRTGTTGAPIYERTIYIDGIFEYVKLEDGTTYEKNYIHIMDDKSRIAEVRINGSNGVFPGDIADDVTYNLESNIGSAVVRLDTTGTVIDREEYYPFGDSSLRTFTYKRYRYVGKERDQESGLYYYGARYYATWTCRFISVDPLAANYSQITPYNYANQNPINDFDIDGMQDRNTPIQPGKIAPFPPAGTPHIRTTHSFVNGQWYRQQAGVDVTPGVLNRVNRNNALNGGLGEKVTPTQAMVNWYPIKGPAPIIVTTPTTITNNTTQYSGSFQGDGVTPGPATSNRIITLPNSGNITSFTIQVMTGNVEGNTITLTNLTTGTTIYNSWAATGTDTNPTLTAPVSLSGVSPGDQIQITQTNSGTPTANDVWRYVINVTNTTSSVGTPSVQTPPPGNAPASSPGFPVTPQVINVSTTNIVNNPINVTSETNGL